MKPKTYQEWILSVGENEEIGIKMLVTDELLRQAKTDVLESTFEIMRSQFVRYLIDRGQKPDTMQLDIERDAFMKAYEIIAIVEAHQGTTIEDYAGYISVEAQQLFAEVYSWENKSLWQYLKWWFNRKFRGK
jgi:hypothetical protein